jgi:hypothetical protein
MLFFNFFQELRTLLFGNIAQSFSDDWKIQNVILKLV